MSILDKRNKKKTISPWIITVEIEGTKHQVYVDTVRFGIRTIPAATIGSFHRPSSQVMENNFTIITPDPSFFHKLMCWQAMKENGKFTMEIVDTCSGRKFECHRVQVCSIAPDRIADHISKVECELGYIM